MFFWGILIASCIMKNAFLFQRNTQFTSRMIWKEFWWNIWGFLPGSLMYYLLNNRFFSRYLSWDGKESFSSALIFVALLGSKTISTPCQLCWGDLKLWKQCPWKKGDCKLLRARRVCFAGKNISEFFGHLWRHSKGHALFESWRHFTCQRQLAQICIYP